MSKTIAIDFDGVVHRYSKGWQEGKLYDPPVEGAVEAFYKLIDAGYDVVFFSTREYNEEMRKWMQKYFDFEKHLGAFYEPKVTNIKPLAIAYIDDRGIRFTNWADILKYFI